MLGLINRAVDRALTGTPPSESPFYSKICGTKQKIKTKTSAINPHNSTLAYWKSFRSLCLLRSPYHAISPYLKIRGLWDSLLTDWTGACRHIRPDRHWSFLFLGRNPQAKTEDILYPFCKHFMEILMRISLTGVSVSLSQFFLCITALKFL